MWDAWQQREHLVYRFPHLLWQAFQYEVIGVIDHFAKLFPGKAAIGMHGVPVLFVHVVAGLYFRIAFTQFNGPFRVAFYVELSAG